MIHRHRYKSFFSKYKHNDCFKNKLNTNSKRISFKKLSRITSAYSPLYYKPISLLHLKELSKFLKRSINLWSNDRIISTFGKYSENPKIDVEYVENQFKNGNQYLIGHYTLKGKKEPYANDIKYPNNCLFDVLGSQTGVHPNKLRRIVIKEERKKSKRKVKKRLLKRFPTAPEIYGGARYNGRNQQKAKEILDSSQEGESHPDRQSGHPRGHASYPNATGYKDSVENYSKSGRKTGFLSRSDQDFVAHLVLISPAAQDVMEVLNYLGENANKEAVTVRTKDLQADDDDIPNAQEWIYGEKKGEPARIRDVVVVMKHFYEKYKDDRADVFVLTLYPRL